MIHPVRYRRVPCAMVSRLVAAACLMASTTAAVAADDRVTLVAHAGLDTRARAGRWTPVVVTIENSGTDITADLVVEAGRVRVVRALALPAPSRKRLEQYVRVPSADLDRIHVALVVSGREVHAVDAPVRIVPDDARFVLCVQPGGSTQPEPSCTATVDGATLPVSWRGYDALDDLRWPAGERPRLDEDRTAAIEQWKIRRAHELVVAPAAGSLEPPPSRAQVRSLIVVYAGLFLLVTACAQALGRSPWVLYGSLIALVIAGSAATMAQGRIGEGAAILVSDSTVVRAAEALDGAFLSTRGIATFPAFGSFELRPEFSDGIVTGKRESAPAQFAEDGGSLLGGVFGKGQRISFDLEGFSRIATLGIERSADAMRITNLATVDLTDCELPAGFVPGRIPLLRAGSALSISGSSADENAAVTCRLGQAPPTLRSNRDRVEHTGTAVLVYALAAGGVRP
jgi:hypothetical protein